MSTERIIELARTLPRDDFVKRHPGYFLAITDRGEDEPQNFETVDVLSTPSALLAAKPSLEVHPIEKAPGNPYPDRISVGRARNCDVVLRHGSVSKLHASFRPRADGALDVVDLGSQLGTRVNGRLSAPNELTKVAPGFILTLGRVVARIADARMVWELVRAQSAIDTLPGSPGSSSRGSSPGSAPRPLASVPPGPRSSPSAPGSAPRPPGSSPPGGRSAYSTGPIPTPRSPGYSTGPIPTPRSPPSTPGAAAPRGPQEPPGSAPPGATGTSRR